jgi:hypothetical protein
LLVAGVVDHNEVNISLNPFCANTPALFVRTNGGDPVKVSEFIVRFVLGAFAVAHNGVSAFAYVSCGSVAIIKQEDKLCRYTLLREYSRITDFQQRSVEHQES